MGLTGAQPRPPGAPARPADADHVHADAETCSPPTATPLTAVSAGDARGRWYGGGHRPSHPPAAPLRQPPTSAALTLTPPSPGRPTQPTQPPPRPSQPGLHSRGAARLARQPPQRGGRQGSQRRDGCRRQHRPTPTPRRAAAKRPAAVAGTASPPPSQGTPLARTHPTGRRAGHHLACGRGGQTSRSWHGCRPHTCAPPLPPLPCQQRRTTGRRPRQEGAAAAAARGRVRGSGGGDGDCRSQLARRSTPPPPHSKREGRPERSGAPPTDRRGSWQAGRGGVVRGEKRSVEERWGLRARSQGEEGVGRGGHRGRRGSGRRSHE